MTMAGTEPEGARLQDLQPGLAGISGMTPRNLLAATMIVSAMMFVASALAAAKLASHGYWLSAASILLAAALVAASALMHFWTEAGRQKTAALALEHEALKQRCAEAQEAAQQKSRLLATMSHEIRTPLNGVIGMLGLLLETELAAEQRNYANIAHSSARSLVSFLDELLDTAKAEATGATRDAATDITPLVENVTELLAPRAHAKGVEISAFISEAVPKHLPFGELKLRQILFNLAGNAIKFTEKGGIELRVTIEDNSLLISVRDTGIGMSRDELARVFQDYTQANAETQRRFGGTGLGLPISKRVVESLGGSLRVESAPGAGSVFTVSLPLPPAAASHHLERPLAGRTYRLVLTPGFAARHMVESLQELGARVEEHLASAKGIAAALENGNTTAALICDAESAEAVQAGLRKLRRRQKSGAAIPPVWIMLHAEERRPLRHLLSLPATGYFVKPVRRATLVKHLSMQAASGGSTSIIARKTASLRLLLVEDTPVNAMLAQAILRKLGHEVVTVTSGEAALEKLAVDRKFDVVLMDVEMPGISGRETTRQLRQREQAGGLLPLPVLALTANARLEDVESCRASGMNRHLAKPFDREDLEEALEALVMQGPAAQS